MQTATESLGMCEGSVYATHRIYATIHYTLHRSVRNADVAGDHNGPQKGFERTQRAPAQSPHSTAHCHTPAHVRCPPAIELAVSFLQLVRVPSVRSCVDAAVHRDRRATARLADAVGRDYG